VPAPQTPPRVVETTPDRPAPPRTDAAPERPATPAPAARPPAPAPTPAPAPAPDPAAQVAKDVAVIRNVLTQFEAAYASRDAAAVRRIWPSAPASLQGALSAARSYRVEIRNPQIAVQGDAATVTGTRYIRNQPDAGRVQEITQAVTFSLRRGQNGWYIDTVR
jgi:ketosteroid isomerase-like protein